MSFYELSLMIPDDGGSAEWRTGRAEVWMQVEWETTSPAPPTPPPPPRTGFAKTAYPNANYNEVQHYGTSSTNSRLSGSGSLQLIPTYSSNQWNSERLHSAKDFTCPLGKKMLVEAQIRVGNNAESEQQGIWPALLGAGKLVPRGQESRCLAQLRRVGYHGG